MDDDYALALQLQSEFFQDSHTISECNDTFTKKGNEPRSLVDPYWEVTDPNPDVRALFLQFNDRFFWGRLAGIEVRWSPRMTLYSIAYQFKDLCFVFNLKKLKSLTSGRSYISN